jgi:hypothetical protein
LNWLVTERRTISAVSRKGFASYSRGKVTVTLTSRLLRQLKPTCGVMPVDIARSASTAFRISPAVNQRAEHIAGRETDGDSKDCSNPEHLRLRIQSSKLASVTRRHCKLFLTRNGGRLTPASCP